MKRHHVVYGIGVLVVSIIIALAIYNRLPSLSSLVGPTTTPATT